MAYWLNLFSIETWNEFKEHGGKVTGFREGRWSRAQKIKPGDRMLCYLVRAHRWVAVLRVTGTPYIDKDESNRIWQSDLFPVRVPVEVEVEVTPATGAPVKPMLDDLQITSSIENKERWGTAFLGSPARWSDADGELVVQAVKDASDHPVEHELPKSAYATPAVVETEQGVVTVPEDEETAEEAPAKTGTEHTHMQYVLARLGAAMGYNVFIPPGDRKHVWNGQELGQLPRVVEELDLPLVDRAMRIIKNIDVLWLDREAVQAAFEVEKTTSIYSGLLRMTDLLALQPNLYIKCFLVAPDERRDEVLKQVNRATFALTRRPLSSVCRYVPFSGLKAAEKLGEGSWRHMKVSYLDEELAESLVLADA
jgi:predicted RNA-binding protein